MSIAIQTENKDTRVVCMFVWCIIIIKTKVKMTKSEKEY